MENTVNNWKPIYINHSLIVSSSNNQNAFNISADVKQMVFDYYKDIGVQNQKKYLSGLGMTKEEYQADEMHGDLDMQADEWAKLQLEREIKSARSMFPAAQKAGEFLLNKFKQKIEEAQAKAAKEAEKAKETGEAENKIKAAKPDSVLSSSSADSIQPVSKQKQAGKAKQQEKKHYRLQRGLMPGVPVRIVRQSDKKKAAQ